MKDEDIHLVRAISVRIECFHCGGKRRVPGGQRKYGEMIDCPVCEGRGTTSDSITIEQLQRLSLVKRETFNEPPIAPAGLKSVTVNKEPDEFHLDTHGCTTCREAFTKMLLTSDGNDTFDMPEEESRALKEHIMKAHPELQRTWY